MFCNQCGQALPTGSRFCNNCGAQTITGPGLNEPDRRSDLTGYRAQAMGAPLSATMADEQVIFTLRPTMLFVIVWYVIAALVLFAAAALLGWMNLNGWVANWTAFIIILVLGLIAFAVPVSKHLLRRREVYTLTNHKLEMRYGLIAKTVQNIPLRNIQEVTVSASVMQRLMKLGDIEIESASETGKIKLSEIHNPSRYANMILGELRRRN